MNGLDNMTDPTLFIWSIIALGFAATFGWRMAGLLIARHVDPDSLFMTWINAAAHAMVAGVMVIILIYPSGALADTTLTFRLLSFALALGCMIITRILWLSILVGISSFALFQIIIIQYI